MAQFETKNRQAINTLEDASKYQTPEGRSLKVRSDPLNIPSMGDTTGYSQLMEALGTIKPALMDAAIENQADGIAQDITKGKTKAIQGLSKEEIANKNEQLGYDSYGGYIHGEKLGDKLENDWKVTPKEGLNFDDWYKNWWASNVGNSLEGQSQVYTDKLQSAFAKNLINVQSANAKEQSAILVANQENLVSENFYQSFLEAKAQGINPSAEHLDVMTKDIRKFGQNLAPARIDELAYQGALRYAQESGDTSVLNTFYDKKPDGTPGLASKKLTETSRWDAKIRSDIESIQSREYTKINQEALHDKAIKEAKRNDIFLKVIAGGDMKDEDLQALKVSMVKQGLYTSLAEVDSDMGHLMNLNKKSDTKEQTVNALKMRTSIAEGRPMAAKDIVKAFTDESISKEGASTLMSELEQYNRQVASDAKAAAREGKAAAEMYKNVSYGRGESIIDTTFKGLRASLRDDPDKLLELSQDEATLRHSYALRAYTFKDPSEFITNAKQLTDAYRLTQDEEKGADPKASVSPKNLKFIGK